MAPSITSFLFNFIGLTFDWIGKTILIWLPVALVVIFWELWLFYIRWEFVNKLDWILLQIKIPREIMKGPQSMEVFLNALRQTKDGNALEKYWKGHLRAWHSLEIVSLNGEVHFFIRIQKGFRNIIESQLYAQYSDAEITEVDDYTKISLTPDFLEEWEFWGTEPILTGDPALPIKTYVDYKLDQASIKEEQKTDPITALLEFMGSLKDGEQAWFQILIKAKDAKEWKGIGEAFMKKTYDSYKEDKGPMKTLTPADKNLLLAVENNISKMAFDVVLRMMYVTKKDKHDKGRIGAFINSFTTPFSSGIYNGFKPNGSTSVDYPPLKDYRLTRQKKRMVNAYRERGGFYYPMQRPSFVLNSEGLATIYHFPGGVAETPSFGRLDAKKGEPPAGLPF